MRCLGLAAVLRDRQHSVGFIARDMPGSLLHLVAAQGYETWVFPPAFTDQHLSWLGASLGEDVAQTSAVLKTVNANWLIVDHYALDFEWEQQCKRHVSRLCVIDDLANRRHDCDVLLDSLYGRSNNDYTLLAPGARLLLGPRFALLRSQFVSRREQALTQRRSRPPRRVFVSLGGMVSEKLLLIVIAGLVKSDLGLSVYVVVGDNACLAADVARLGDKKNLHVVQWCDDMAAQMAVADVAIGAPGVTSWERCVLGLPTLLIVTADNQRLIAKALVSAGAAVLMGDSADVTSEQVSQHVSALLRAPNLLMRMGEAAASLCDGLGAGRVADELTRIA